MSTLTPAEIGALHEALDDEYQAWTTDDQVLADFGAVRPFSNIRAAEARHVDALSALFVHYGLPIPPNRWPGKVRRFADVRQACEAGVAAESPMGSSTNASLPAPRGRTSWPCCATCRPRRSSGTCRPSDAVRSAMRLLLCENPLPALTEILRHGQSSRLGRASAAVRSLVRPARCRHVSELLALRPCVPLQGVGLEIGVGTGRFAAPLGLQVGVDPSAEVVTRARARGIRVVQGTAEALPLPTASTMHWSSPPCASWIRPNACWRRRAGS